MTLSRFRRRISKPAQRPARPRILLLAEALEDRTLLDANASLVRFAIFAEPSNNDWPSTIEGAPTVPLTPMMVTDVDGSLDRPGDIDVVRVELQAGELFIASLRNFNTLLFNMGTYRLRLLDSAGVELARETFEVQHIPISSPVQKSAGPGSDNSASQNRLSLLHRVEQSGSYFVELADASGLGRSEHRYTLALRTIGLNDGPLDRGFLNTPAQNHIIASLHNNVLEFAGPVGVGFGLRGDWTQTVQTTDNGELFSRYDAQGTVHLQSAIGEIPLPIPTGTSFTVTTEANRWGDLFGDVDTIEWTAQLGPFELAAPLTDAFGFAMNTPFGSASVDRETYGLKLGRDDLVQETNAPVNQNIPYIFYQHNSGLSANFGGFEASVRFGNSWSIVTDPSDIFIYAGVTGIPTPLGELALAGSIKGNIPYTPFARPDDYLGSIFGNIYVQAEVDLTKLVGVPVKVNGEVVIDFDVNDDGQLFGGVFNNPSQFVASGFDPALFGASVGAALGDIAIGVNAEVSVGLRFGDNQGGIGDSIDELVDLSLKVGDGSLIYDPAEDGLFLRGGSASPFDDTFLEDFVPASRVVTDGFIKRDGTFRLTQQTNLQVFGHRLAGTELTIQNLPAFSGVRAEGTARVLGSSVVLTGEIELNGDFRFTGTVNVSLAGIFQGNANVTFTRAGNAVSFRAGLTASLSTEIAGQEFGGSLTLNIGLGLRGNQLTYSGSVSGSLLLGTFSINVGLRIYDDGNEFGLEIDVPAADVLNDIVGGLTDFFGFPSPDIPDVIRVVFPRGQQSPANIIAPPPRPIPIPPPRPQPGPGDFDADGITDFGVFGFFPSEGFARFAISLSGGGTLSVPFGGPNDVPIVGDFDGDGFLDFGVFGFSPDDGFARFAILLSGGGVINQPLGGPNDIPILGDFDGDGITDLGVFGFSPDDGFARFAVVLSGGGVINQPFGGPNDLPIAGDFDGDGKTDIAVYGFSPDEGFARFAVVLSGGGIINQPFGGPNDLPVAGDFVGDGKTDIAVYGFSPDDGFSRFATLPSDGSPATATAFGGSDDLPILADFDGDGINDIAVYGFGRFAILPSGGGPSLTQTFGGIGDIPLPTGSAQFAARSTSLGQPRAAASPSFLDRPALSLQQHSASQFEPIDSSPRAVNATIRNIEMNQGFPSSNSRASAALVAQALDDWGAEATSLVVEKDPEDEAPWRGLHFSTSHLIRCNSRTSPKKRIPSSLPQGKRELIDRIQGFKFVEPRLIGLACTSPEKTGGGTTGGEFTRSSYGWTGNCVGGG